jgi:hypothetical protein
MCGYRRAVIGIFIRNSMSDAPDVTRPDGSGFHFMASALFVDGANAPKPGKISVRRTFGLPIKAWSGIRVRPRSPKDQALMLLVGPNRR